METCFNVCLALGCWELIKVAYSTTSFLFRHLRPGYDLFRRYGGRGAWVLVTGGSDGIGLEMCK
jgi:hypothetical protein